MRLTSKFVAISVATALRCAAAAAVWIARSAEPARATAASGEVRPVWTETDWPFGADPWGKGKAFRCRADDCGGEVQLYVRAKLGLQPLARTASGESDGESSRPRCRRSPEGAVGEHGKGPMGGNFPATI